MGKLIEFLRFGIESIAGNRKWALLIGGGLITILLTFISGISGWLIERLYLRGSPIPNLFGSVVLLVSLSSGLATGSLKKAVNSVIKVVPKGECQTKLEVARRKLKQIVGRNVEELNKQEILRATAETASENAVDGIFAPLFWILIGTFLWELDQKLPGPLALLWVFKATSTIDSMIGHRVGKLEWLGKVGARTDDVLTWLPCRLVLITLPLVCKSWDLFPKLVSSAFKEGCKDESPNSGLSEAIFAHCANIQMGGENNYGDRKIIKPKLAINSNPANIDSIKTIINIGIRLEFAWVLTSCCICILYLLI